MGSLIRVRDKIGEKIRLSVHESESSFNPERDFDSPRSFNSQLYLSCKHGLKLDFKVSLGIECQSGLM